MGGLQSTTEIVDIVKVVRDAGTIGVLLFVIVSGARGWWVFGQHYREMKDERDIYRAALMKSMKHAEKALTVAEIVTQALDEAGAK